MGAEHAEARQTLTDHWDVIGDPPAPYSGSNYQQDKTVAIGHATTVPTCGGTPTINTVFVASKTWVGGSTGGYALTLLRYKYEDGSVIGTPLVWPAAPNDANYFVPTAMKIIPDACEDSTEAAFAGIYILVTGYGPAAAHGTTDFHTVCFNGNLTERWSVKYSRPGGFEEITPPDEYPVDIAWSPGTRYDNSVEPPLAIGTWFAVVTGNTWNGYNWDIQTVWHDIQNYGTVFHVETGASAGGLHDKACGLGMGFHQGSHPNPVAYVVGTHGEGAGNTLITYEYTTDPEDPVTWLTDTRTLSLSGVTLKANAMQAIGPGFDIVYAPGQHATSMRSDMLLAKFDFGGSSGYYTTFSFDTSGTRAGEAVAMKYLHYESSPVWIALTGYSRRSSSLGNDAIVCLFKEDSGSPVLHWSAWQNVDETTYNVQDVCSTVDIDVRHGSSSTDPDAYLVYVSGQVPTSSTDMDWRGAVYTSDDDGISDPADPDQKARYGNKVDISGASAGGDLPRAMVLNPFYDDVGAHNFIVTGDSWNGSSGFDILTRRFRFTEPE